MSVKRYGIYLAYPPAIDLRGHGLGRLLGAFLKNVHEGGQDVEFIIACPSWVKESLLELCEAEGVDAAGFDIIRPDKKPLVLRLYDFIHLRRKRRRVDSLKFVSWVQDKFLLMQLFVEKKLLGTRSIFIAVGFILLLTPVLLLALIFKFVSHCIYSILVFARPRTRIVSILQRLGIQLSNPSRDPVIVRKYELLEEAELRLLLKLINDRTDISAWYCPTAFWPSFNQISAPRLMCVPDVVINQFPVGFAEVGRTDLITAFNKVEDAIRGGQHFVTYSNEVKWSTLVDYYQVDPKSVHVVPHGANRFDEHIYLSEVEGEDSAMIDTLARTIFTTAVMKTVNSNKASFFASGQIRFMFFASQFRPNKNILTLLRAYNYLLKKRCIDHKLILTGDPAVLPDVCAYLDKHNLNDDVLCLRGLTVQELAACYRLADLALNPSLSEGGLPFTFTEALSVGTPVVMARIPVTEEIISDRNPRTAMLFDPYNWKDMAERIVWALENRDKLLERQLKIYKKLTQRTWANVVSEHIEILERISTAVDEPSAPLSNITASPIFPLTK